MNMFLLLSSISADVFISHRGTNGIKTYLDDGLKFVGEKEKGQAARIKPIPISNRSVGNVILALDGNYILEVDKEGQVIKTAFNGSNSQESDISKSKSVSIDEGEEGIVFKEIVIDTTNEINITQGDKCLIIGPGRKFKTASGLLCTVQNSKFQLETAPEEKTNKKPEEQKKAASTEKSKKDTPSKPGKGDIKEDSETVIAEVEPKQNTIKRKNPVNSTGSTENVKASIEALSEQFKKLLNKEEEVENAIKDLKGQNQTPFKPDVISKPNDILSNSASNQNGGDNRVKRPLSGPKQLAKPEDSNTPKDNSTDKIDKVLKEIDDLNKNLLSLRSSGVGNLPNQVTSPASNQPIPSASNQPVQIAANQPAQIVTNQPTLPALNQVALPAQIATNQPTLPVQAIQPAPIQLASNPSLAQNQATQQPNFLPTTENPSIIPLQNVGLPQSNSTLPNTTLNQGGTYNDPNNSPVSIGDSLATMGNQIKTNTTNAAANATRSFMSDFLLTLLANTQGNQRPNPLFNQLGYNSNNPISV